LGELEPVHKKRLYEQIVDQLAQAIAHGHFQPGDQLPSERVLANRFGVSRPVVREALTVLQEYGLIEIRHGSGAFVRQGAQKLVDSLEIMHPVSREELLALLEVRLLIESGAAALAAERASPEQVAALEDAYRQMEQQVQKGGLAVEEDLNFHAALARATQNAVLLQVLNTISDLMRQGLYRSRSDSLRIPGKPLIVLEEHKQILEAVKNRKPEAARQALIRHLENVRVRFTAKGEESLDV